MVRGNLRGRSARGGVAAICGVAFLLFGYDQGVLGAVIGLDSFRKEFNDPNRYLEGVIAGIYDIGCFLGAMLAFVTADRLGRKGSVVWGTWIMVVGTILQTSATENIQMILSRTITGIGNGMNTVNVPIWQSESFKSHNRGAMLIIQSALIALGHPLSTFMGLASRQAEPSSFGWRWPIAFQGVFMLLILLGLPFLPESPRWLVHKGRIDEATDVFAILSGNTIDDPQTLLERDEIVASVEEEKKLGEATWGEVFTEGPNRNISRVLLGAGPYMMNQWSGINSLAYFLPITFERNLNMTTELSLIIAGVLGVQYFFVSWLPYFFIEKVGRRKMLMGSAAACSFCMIMIAIMRKVNTVPSQWVFVAFTFIFFDVFSLGILPVSWMYASEIMPLRTRNKGVALGVGSHWLSNFVVVFVTPDAIDNLKHWLYVIWAVLNASFVPITWLWYPETARRSLEDMDEIFRHERFGLTKTRSPGNRTKEGGDGVIRRDAEEAIIFANEKGSPHS
ncbi:MAG: hypothetical protein Q9210_005134 [Variospora velana]